MAQELRVLLPQDNKPIQNLEEYKAASGLKGLQRARSMAPREVIDEVKKAGLRGRGGAGFPAAIKWTTAFEDTSSRKFVVCNGSEGEPGTYKDRYLIQKNPYQLVEGIMIVSHVVGAEQAFIGMKAKFIREVARVKKAIEEMTQAGFIKPGYLEVVPGPDEYLFGEEKALLEVVDGRGALPRIMPPFMQGVRCAPGEYNPTVVNNVETLSHVSHIMAKGAEWFRSIGCADTPGTMIFTLCGDVKRPGMYELPLGTTLRELIYDLGGGPAGGHPIRAVFSGVANKVMTPEIFDTPMAFGTLREAGGGLGSAGFIVYDESMCMVKAAAMFSSFLARESCGQCVPCNTGARLITEHLRLYESGQAKSHTMEDILTECGRVTNQTRCFLPAEESILISSMVRKFVKDFEAHVQSPCPHSREPQLPLIDSYDENTRQFTYAPPK
ncbi:MAG: NADH-ubiquinone oxidoreductase-F iron-sulfur binding region domain-containing protein [Candidatus Omnitrophota bacterium]|nr:NADH-ubiquinone oxidoreductase-F iron-sulfur binding region domain-containing protein [Candidatus Omnitrophota bacterium]MDZ4241339.1 NADH-ubiquinone oxidoreductase-F iron-sulfur binding region domain-containing protein [Candidatus Omnitrophota bacterium]